MEVGGKRLQICEGEIQKPRRKLPPTPGQVTKTAPPRKPKRTANDSPELEVNPEVNITVQISRVILFSRIAWMRIILSCDNNVNRLLVIYMQFRRNTVQAIRQKVTRHENCTLSSISHVRHFLDLRIIHNLLFN